MLPTPLGKGVVNLKHITTILILLLSISASHSFSHMQLSKRDLSTPKQYNRNTNKDTAIVAITTVFNWNRSKEYNFFLSTN